MMVKFIIPRSELCDKVFSATVLLVLFLVLGSMTPVSAHTTVNVDRIAIDAGWGIEPPVVGIRNDFVFKITEPGEKETLTIYPDKEEVYKYFDKRERLEHLGFLEVKTVVHSDEFTGIWHDLI